MITALRDKFNAGFSDEKYTAFLKDLEHYAGDKIPFRIAETPVFIPSDLKSKLVHACDEIIRVVREPAYLKISDRAIPASQFVPGEEGRPMWLAFDFAVCVDAKGAYDPQLIELQGFPSLFYYQHLLAGKYREHFGITENVTHIPGMEEATYVNEIKSMLLGDHSSENVILLEVEPGKQNTRIDFVATENFTSIKTVCITELKRRSNKLYYRNNGREIPVHRIYNRIIFDEFLKRNDLKVDFHLTEPVDVEWAGHPNWFFRISKFTMPFLRSPFVPVTHFLDELKSIPGDLENYVLKPLFSFSGSGVIFNVTTDDIHRVTDPGNWILQKKVKYEPVIHSPVGKIKTEIRMLYGWKPGDLNPRLMINMARLSQGEMIGVKYNKDKSWVGGSVGMFEKN